MPSVSAQSRLTYPIAELGFCRDAKECYLYCEIPENKAACWSYGKYIVGNDVLGVTTMNADEKRMMEEKAKRYNVTFPIADLGNCAGPQECRDFCENPANQTVCMDFARKKGFDKEMERSDGMDANRRNELLDKAKIELGCTSMESCSRICENDHELCKTFAKKYGVYKEPPQPRDRYTIKEKQELMQNARLELGCTSMESCKSTCEKNPERCMAFAKKHGIGDDEKEEEKQEKPKEQFGNRQYQRGEPDNDASDYHNERFDDDGMPELGENLLPGKRDCDSEESCKKYCQEHPNECPGFQGYTRATQGGGQSSTQMMQKSQNSYVGPSGCRTEAECKNWCESNPDKCPGLSEAKQREESAKREYEIKKKEMNRSQEMMQKRTQEHRPPTQNYPTTGTQPAYETTQPSPGSYTPSLTRPATP